MWDTIMIILLGLLLAFIVLTIIIIDAMPGGL